MCARPRRVPSSRETGASSPQPPRNLEGMRSPAPSVQGDGHPPFHRKETPLRCPSPFRASPLQLRRAAHLAASFPPSHGAASRVIEVGFSVSGKATRSRGRLVRELTTAFKLQKQPRRCAALAAARARRPPHPLAGSLEPWIQQPRGQMQAIQEERAGRPCPWYRIPRRRKGRPWTSPMVGVGKNIFFGAREF